MTEQYKQSALNVVRALDAAGASIGLGLWRPSQDGPYGQFKVAEVVIEEPVDVIDELSVQK